ncbi:MAG: hypothetical protein EOS73_16860 [Mesorhizobium sp.]|uniref:hypothetical protein n=1 Tax=Mesorhizobium sp. M7A.F.Ca.ET.027.02.1.1 TaxID=2496655 RepID=UPI000FD18B1C|nr:hypothetical protein [Mesorhizobium sp. M7A.F.Ca.ET.027.02.1.1]RVD18319.1 hypothetical protein EN749_05470 [Mesorhizobium sp. M7A.F.Ca.ET.027.02.1.1]RWD07174.1 MAG: hypothetical protein EOS73_16860 [Mesorhizobium sp.]
MHRSVTTGCCRLALKSAAALALTIAPYQIVLDGSVPGIHTASAYAKGGGNSGGGGGNSGGGNGGNSGNGNSGNSGKSGSNQGKSGSHVNAKTGDKIDVTGNKITVRHPDGITEKLENGRFSMKDALGRTIIDRQATPADADRLKAL